ncbi:hypothetical protein [Roseibium sp. MMSF_3247]|nr:hypothetical protein [Roseibium sp. MMSF_3247]
MEVFVDWLGTFPIDGVAKAGALAAPGDTEGAFTPDTDKPDRLPGALEAL